MRELLPFAETDLYYLGLEEISLFTFYPKYMMNYVSNLFEKHVNNTIIRIRK